MKIQFVNNPIRNSYRGAYASFTEVGEIHDLEDAVAQQLLADHPRLFRKVVDPPVAIIEPTVDPLDADETPTATEVEQSADVVVDDDAEASDSDDEEDGDDESKVIQVLTTSGPLRPSEIASALGYTSWFEVRSVIRELVEKELIVKNDEGQYLLAQGQR